MDPRHRTAPSHARLGRRSALIAVVGMAVSVAWAAPIDDARPLVGASWYTVTILDQRVGYASSTVKIDDTAAGGPVLRIVDTLEASIKLAQGQEGLKLSQEIVSVFDANLRPVSILSTADEFGRERVVEAHARDGALEVTSKAGGAETHRTVALTPEFGSDLLLPMDIAAGRFTVGQKRTLDVFNPELLSLDRMTASFDEKTTLEDGRTAYRITVESSTLPVATESLFDEHGSLIQSTTKALLRLTLKEATEEEALKAAAPLVLSSRIETDAKVGDPRKLELMKLRVHSSTEPASELVPVTARQTVEADGEDAVVTVRRVPALGVTTTLPLDPGVFAEYLKPTEMGQIDDPAILAKAREIVGGETDARKAAERIVMWVYEHMDKVESEPRLISAREVLEQMSGDCTEHSILCTALCAAAGIPAKMLAGLAYARGGVYYHAWTEVYVGQWVEMDPTWGETAVDAGHIRLASATLDSKSMAGLGLAVGRSLGSVTLKVVEHQETGEPGGAGAPGHTDAPAQTH